MWRSAGFGSTYDVPARDVAGGERIISMRPFREFRFTMWSASKYRTATKPAPRSLHEPLRYPQSNDAADAAGYWKAMGGAPAGLIGMHFTPASLLVIAGRQRRRKSGILAMLVAIRCACPKVMS